MNSTDLNISLRWNSLSVQPERECQLLSTMKIKTSFLSREPHKWYFKHVPSGTTWTKIKFKKSANMLEPKWKALSYKWPIGPSEPFVLVTRNLVLMMICRLKMKKGFLMLKRRTLLFWLSLECKISQDQKSHMPLHNAILQELRSEWLQVTILWQQGQLLRMLVFLKETKIKLSWKEQSSLD